MNRQERRAAARGTGQGSGGKAGRAEALFAQGAERHGAGDLAAAEGLYREALRADPAHAGALHYLGLLAAQAGRLEEAARLVGKAAARRPRDAAILRDLAKVRLGGGDAAAAEAPARAAVAAAPGDPAAAMVLGATLARLGRGEEAEARLRRALDLAPGHPEVLNHLGVALAGQGRYGEAAAAFEAALASAPDFGEALVNLAEARLAAGESGAAEGLVRQALELAPGHPQLLDLLGRALASAGRLQEALAAQRAAVAAAPGDPQLAFNLAASLQETGETAAAEKAYRDLLRAAPGFAAAWANLGALLLQGERTEAALEACETALRHDPGHLEARINLATALEQASRLEAAAEQLRLGLERTPAHPALRLLEAKLERRAGRPEAAAERLAAPPPEAAPAALRQDWLYERGRCLDQAARPAEAFAAFAEANALAAAEGAALRARQGETRRLIAALAERFTADWVAGWTPLPAPEEEPPVFLVGFPRSGTTLLHHVLAGHSRLQVMEEVQALDAARAVVEAAPGGYPEGLAALAPETAAAARAAYWRAARAALPAEPGRRLVDKLPLNLVQLGLVQRLWPQAPVILALRHPCDVCLSAFMQHFDLNDAMANFLSLEDAGDFYDAVMGLFARYEAALPLRLARLRYEDLLQDFDGETGRLLDFLELAWEPSVRDFVATARARGRINTPSYSQVTEGLYTRARYRWERYRPQLTPLLRRVEPWAERFGYGSPDRAEA